jgi:NitT/TauT family transport system substrate-binding protein
VSNIVASLVNGEANFGFVPIANLIYAQANGTDIRCLSTDQGIVDPSNTQATLLMVKAGSTITSPAQLAGKKVGLVSLGGINQLFLLNAVDMAGGDWSKVQSLQLPFTELQAALTDGRVDAVVTTLPYTTPILASGAKSLASQEVSFIPNGTGACYASSEKYIQAHPEVVNAFIAANRQSLNYAAQHIDQAMATLPQFLSLTPAQAAQQKPSSIYNPDFNVPSIEKQADLMVKYKFITQTVPLNKIVYTP